MSFELDNPVWHALTGEDRHLNVCTGGFAYFDSEVAPFIGMADWTEGSQRALYRHLPVGRTGFLMIAGEVRLLEDWEVPVSIPLYQLTCADAAVLAFPEHGSRIIPLRQEHVGEMVTLATLTRPGPFRSRTIEFGNYHGIFEDGKLVAMGGERLHVGGFTELSAICTHPSHRGLGYGAAITHHLMRKVAEQGRIPFLHARQDNEGAIRLYQRLGFGIRCDMSFHLFCRR